jgi:hypothetical protein
MYRLIVVLSLLVSFVAIPASAQDATPDAQRICSLGHVCVVYNETPIEIDPELGFYQAFVVKQEITETQELMQGQVVTTMTDMVTLAGYKSNGDTYELDDVYEEKREGTFASADLLDVFILRESD